jgi:hypothetical protein
VGIIKAIYFLIRAFLAPRLSLAAENLALRQQVAVYKHSVKRPKLRARDRFFWALLPRFRANGPTALVIEEGLMAPRPPWQNPFCERVFGSIRREVVDHVIVLNEAHLRRILSSHFAYYHHSRPHLLLERNSPVP